MKGIYLFAFSISNLQIIFRSNDPIYNKYTPLTSEEEITCNRMKLDQIFVESGTIDKNTLSPGWFGKGLKKKN